MSKNILFVSHDAALMGAPMVLLHFISWIKQNTDHGVTILLKAAGPLQTQLETLGEVYCWRPEQLSASISLRIGKQFTGKPAHVPYPQKLKDQKFDLVYLNTAYSIDLAPMLKQFYKCPVIAHIHELSYSINAYFSQAFSADNVAAINHYIAVSNSVANGLIVDRKIPRQKITVFNEFIPIDDIIKTTVSASVIKNELGIIEKFIVGASGQAGWRKGTDLFVQVAHQVNKKLPDHNIVFVWVGNQSTEAAAQSSYEIEKLDLKNKVIFTGSKTNPQNYFQAFDIFLLTSREDPFPLVSLEAAALNKPIFCFKDTGGIPEIIDETTGMTFNYNDVEAMANGIITAYQQPDKTRQTGINAAEMIKKYDVKVIAPQLLNHIIAYAG